MVQSKEQDLIQRYQEKRDAESLGLLLQLYSGGAYNMALRFMGNANDAEDMVQQAFLKIIQDIGQYQVGIAFKGLVMRYVIFSCQNKIKHEVRLKKREQRTAENQKEITSDTDDKQELKNIILRYLDQLSAKMRTPIWLHYHEGMSFKEISDVLSIPESTVIYQTKSGIKHLRQRLTQIGFSASTALIATALESAPNLPVPIALFDRIMDLSLHPESHADSTAELIREPTISNGKALASRLPFALIIGSIAIASSAFFIQNMKPSTTPETVTKTPTTTVPSPPPAVNKFWDFNDGIPDSFKLIYGSWHHNKGNGVNGTGCIQMDSEELLARINPKVAALPIRISFDAKMLHKDKKKTKHGKAWVGWTEWKGPGTNIGLPKKGIAVKATDIIHHDIYITHEHIDAWITSRKFSNRYKLYFQKSDIKPLGLYVSGMDLIDNLSIQSIEASQIPDCRRYREALARIPLEKRVGSIFTPEFDKPGSPRAAFFQFINGSSPALPTAKQTLERPKN